MRKILGLSLALLAGSGCIIVPSRGAVYRPHRYHGAAIVAPKHQRVCPPSYRWDGYACVHNGRGHGHGYGRR